MKPSSLLASCLMAVSLAGCSDGTEGANGGDGDASLDASSSDGAGDVGSLDSDTALAVDGASETSTDSMADATTSADAMTSGDTLTKSDAPADTAPVRAFPLADPPSGFTGLTTSAPLVLVGEKGKTVSRLSITNPDGPCIIVRGGEDIVLEHLAIGPCKGDGVKIEGGAARITLRDSYVHDTVDNGVTSASSTDIVVTGSWFARNRSGGYFVDSTGVRFERNSVLNVQGGNARGQLAQFNRVTGANNAIRCNLAENRPGESNPEDAVNLFQSHGTATSPILAEGNRVKGGGPSTSGGGVLLGDGGGTYQISRWNILVDPGQYGTAVAGGSHMTVEKNQVYARQQSFTNVGIYVWDQYSSSCTDVTVRDNRVDWTNAKGEKNPYWNGANCSALTESANDWSATLSEAILETVPDPCK